MPKFRYRALDSSGHLVAGVIEAASTQLSCRSSKNLIPAGGDQDESQPRSFSLRSLFARKPTREEISGISEDLATLIKGGVTLDRACSILSETVVRRRSATSCATCTARYRSVQPGGGGVRSTPDLFPKTFAKMVEVAGGCRHARRDACRVIAHERRAGEP